MAHADRTRDPCPWVILNDSGGAFSMGAIGGTIWHGIKGSRNSPRVSSITKDLLADLFVCFEVVIVSSTDGLNKTSGIETSRRIGCDQGPSARSGRQLWCVGDHVFDV